MLLIHFFTQFISKQLYLSTHLNSCSSWRITKSFKIISTILKSGAEEKFDIRKTCGEWVATGNGANVNLRAHV